MTRLADPNVLRADLHVHSYHSGHARHLSFLRTRDCYSDPEAVYRTAKARGMDLVTITDHDSIDGCLEFLERHPGADDFFVSEEIECLFPDAPLKAHVAAYDIDERIHREIQPLRANVYDVVAYLRERDILFALNHLFFFFDGQMPLERYLAAVLPLVPAFETRNGAMLADHNQLIEEVLPRGAAVVGGSDAHTLAFVGTTYTEAPGRTRQDFLASLRAGNTRVGGRHGSAIRVAAEIYGVVFRYWASLVGRGRQELSWARRGVGLAFSALSMPFEFIPALVAVIDKSGERRRIAAFRRQWHALNRQQAPAAASSRARANARRDVGVDLASKSGSDVFTERIVATNRRDRSERPAAAAGAPAQSR